MAVAPGAGGRLLPALVRSVVSGSSEFKNTVQHCKHQHVLKSQGLHTFTQNKPISLNSICLSSNNSPNFPALYKLLPSQLEFSSTSFNHNLTLAHNENTHAHKVMIDLPIYSSSTVPDDAIENFLSPIDHTQCPPPLPNIQWDHISTPSLIGSFVMVSKGSVENDHNITNPIFSPLIRQLVKSSPLFSINQIKELLAALSLWKNIDSANATNYKELWNALDRECVKKVKTLSTEESFIVAELFYQLNLSRICAYTRSMLNVVAHKLPSLEPHYLVLFGFHLNLCRTNPGNVSHLNYERAVEKSLEKISLDELGVIAMGLFKTQTFVQSDDLSNAIFNRLLSSDLSKTSNITLAAIFKLLRKSVKAYQSDQVYKLIDHVAPIVKNLSLPSQLQVALLGCECLVFQPKVITDIAISFVNQLSLLRLKDIERMALALMIFNFIPQYKHDILNVFQNELRNPNRREEINMYPKSFFSCINYMATMGYMSEDLISTALHPQIVNSILTSVNYADVGREILELDYTVGIEFPTYKGFRLDPMRKMTLSKKYFEKYKVPSDVPARQRRFLTHQERLLIEVEDKMKSFIGNDRSVLTTFVLPHSTIPDIVFCTNKKGQGVDIPHMYENTPRTAVKVPIASDKEAVRYNALIVGGRNNFIRGSNRVRGQTQMKIRQLKFLGYSVVLLPYMDFSKKSARKKMEAIDSLLTCNGILELDEERATEAYNNWRTKRELLEGVD